MAVVTGYMLSAPVLPFGSTRVISASTTKAGAIYFTNKEITVRYIGTTFTALSGSPALDLRVETVSTLLPSGTLWATNTNAAYSPVATNSYVWTQLTADATITAGSVFALVVGYTSGTSATCRYNTGNTLSSNYYLPYSTVMASGSWALGAASPVICAKLSDGTILRGGYPINTFTSDAFQSSTNPNERAVVFTVAAATTLVGVIFHGAMAATAACTISVYSGTSTSAMSGGTITVGAGLAASTSTGMFGPLFFDAPITLNAGTYRLAVKATAAANVTLAKLTFPGTDERDVSVGEMREDTRNGGAWIGETTTTSPMIYPIFDDMTAGGLLRHPGMSGGMLG